VNFAAWEVKHPTLNKDPSHFDHKHNCCGFKYEVRLEIYSSQIAWINGPKKAGKNNKQEDNLPRKERIERQVSGWARQNGSC
jgi:hypothetical protein